MPFCANSDCVKAWDINGYVKYMATYSMPDEQGNTLDHLLHNRINVEYRFSPEWRINLGQQLCANK